MPIGEKQVTKQLKRQCYLFMHLLAASQIIDYQYGRLLVKR